MGLGVPWLSARLTKVPGSSELEGRTHNVTPVSHRTRAQARVRLAPTGVRYACGSDARGVYRTALLFDRSRGRPLIGAAEHDQRTRHGRRGLLDGSAGREAARGVGPAPIRNHAISTTDQRMLTKKKNKTNIDNNVVPEMLGELSNEGTVISRDFVRPPLHRRYGYSL
jgi:hypothetical protein